MNVGVLIEPISGIASHPWDAVNTAPCVRRRSQREIAFDKTDKGGSVSDAWSLIAWASSRILHADANAHPLIQSRHSFDAIATTDRAGGAFRCGGDGENLKLTHYPPARFQQAPNLRSA